MNEDLVLALFEWLIVRALAGVPEAGLLAGLCERMVAAGLPLLRVSTGADLLHPVVEGQGVTWVREEGVEQESYARTVTPQQERMWRRSPFYQLVVNRLPRLRRRSKVDYQMGEFPLLDDLGARGATDYLALRADVGEQASLGTARGFCSSWTSDRAGGFTESEIKLIERVAAALAFVFNAAGNVANGRTLLDTYLGADAAGRVLSGNIVRGQAEAIRAAVWFSDLQDFTRIADSAAPESALALLNDYAGCLADAIQANGGQVLKFMGDGILGIFRDDDPTRACVRALDTARDAGRDVRRLNEARRADGLPRTDFTLALHFGDLLYGNFGSGTRLDFTVLGPAVNEASRIAGMCRSLDQRVVASSVFAGAAGDRRADLVSLGRYALKGVGKPQELFTLDPSALPDPSRSTA
ncbi:MAG: adenylate/guanylate cyclase domain-containing protein [Alphaproteobacteria bacterium]